MLKLNMKKKILNIFKFENFCGIFSKLNKLTRFLDEITMFDKHIEHDQIVINFSVSRMKNI